MKKPDSCQFVQSVDSPTPAQILANFLDQHSKPYSLAQAADLTGIPIKNLVPLHAAEQSAGHTREIEPGIWISASAHSLARTIILNGQTWRFSLEIANLILDELSLEPAYSARILARRIGYSHQTACVYLTALLSIKAVGISPQGYVAISSANLDRLGCDIDPAILTTTRKALGIPGRKKNHAS